MLPEEIEPSQEPTAVVRAGVALLWSLKIALLYAILNYVFWQIGCQTDKRGAPRDSEDVVAAVILMAVAAPAASVVVAIFKPWCTSFLRCTLVGFLACLPFVVSVHTLIGSPGNPLDLVVETLKASAITSPLAGWMLWQYAKQGPEWRWPFKDND